MPYPLVNGEYKASKVLSTFETYDEIELRLLAEAEELENEEDGSES